MKTESSIVDPESETVSQANLREMNPGRRPHRVAPTLLFAGVVAFSPGISLADAQESLQVDLVYRIGEDCDDGITENCEFDHRHVDEGTQGDLHEIDLADDSEFDYPQFSSENGDLQATPNFRKFVARCVENDLLFEQNINCTIDPLFPEYGALYDQGASNRDYLVRSCSATGGSNDKCPINFVRLFMEPTTGQGSENVVATRCEDVGCIGDEAENVDYDVELTWPVPFQSSVQYDWCITSTSEGEVFDSSGSGDCSGSYNFGTYSPAQNTGSEFRLENATSPPPSGSIYLHVTPQSGDGSLAPHRQFSLPIIGPHLEHSTTGGFINDECLPVARGNIDELVDALLFAVKWYSPDDAAYAGLNGAQLPAIYELQLDKDGDDIADEFHDMYNPNSASKTDYMEGLLFRYNAEAEGITVSDLRQWAYRFRFQPRPTDGTGEEVFLPASGWCSLIVGRTIPGLSGMYALLLAAAIGVCAQWFSNRPAGRRPRSF